MYVKNIRGKKFGCLLAIEPTPERNRGNVVWRCKCDCGKTFFTTASALLRGTTISCGHVRREKAVVTAKKGKNHTTHGFSKTKLYQVWGGIKARCNNPNNKNYKNYGARGISICPEWEKDFKIFHDYVCKLPHFQEPGYSIDRIDNDGNYEPGNVRYADRRTQYYNSRRFKKNGVTDQRVQSTGSNTV